MNFEISLLPVLGGYWLLTHLIPTRIEARRQSGYHLAFQSAAAGLVLWVVAYAILYGIEHWSCSLMHDFLGAGIRADFKSAAIMSVALGFLSPFALNRLFDHGKEEERVAAEYGDLVELLVADAIRRSKLIEISLQSGKSYIGLVLGNTISKWPEADLSLLPTSSGYRDRDTQQLKITTHYAPVVREYLAGAQGSFDSISQQLYDLRIVIPRSEIVSARLFDPELYSKFQASAE